ncbi:OsmC family protein [Streptosporangium carneum]|uniref:Peroxiredoxin n=1 Tax=Streptosporangium carneum TaxID=47481 RepID=A0A9W6IAW0_9ACTN|nr:OsmC family protein [Streptosporangium carneum]GLK15286.1 peroxiredoxin [Streptosporangium carneum]
MRSEELRALQAPLKAEYRREPRSAVVTLSAEGRVEERGIACAVSTDQGVTVAGLHPATGGDGTLACSGDMLLEALVACAGVTLRAVATALDYPVAGCVVRAEGDLDFRGTLGVDKEAPVGFGEVRLSFEIEGDLSPEQRAKLVELTERYCVVAQSLRAPVPFVVSPA